MAKIGPINYRRIFFRLWGPNAAREHGRCMSIRAENGVTVTAVVTADQLSGDHWWCFSLQWCHRWWMVIHHVGIHRGDTAVNGDAAASPFTEGILAMTGRDKLHFHLAWARNRGWGSNCPTPHLPNPTRPSSLEVCLLPSHLGLKRGTGSYKTKVLP